MFVRSHDTDILCNRLRKAALGELVPWEDLDKEIASDVRGSPRARGCLQSARRILLGEGVAFRTEVGVGLKRCNADDAVDVMDAAHRHIRGVSKKALCIGATVNKEGYDGLPPERRARLDALRSLHGMTEAMARGNSVKKLAAACKDAGQTLALARTLEVLGS